MKYREYFTKILLGAEDNDFVMEVFKGGGNKIEWEK